MIKTVEILDEMFPNAKCELQHKNGYELLVAIILSAQTTDIAVNKVTPLLFEKYKTIYELAHANVEDVEKIVRNIGLYRNKAKNIVMMANKVVDNYNGFIPETLEELCKLDGVGRKTASVYLVDHCLIPSVPVDTHVFRVSKRLGISKEDATVLEVEKDIKRLFPENVWIKLHHQLIFLGRYQCHAKKPNCLSCKLVKHCKHGVEINEGKTN